jgi:hypothetical protein
MCKLWSEKVLYMCYRLFQVMYTVTVVKPACILQWNCKLWSKIVLYMCYGLSQVMYTVAVAKPAGILQWKCKLWSKKFWTCATDGYK